MKFILKVIPAFIIISCPLRVNGQDTSPDKQLWTNYSVRNYIDNWRIWLYNDVSVRYTINNSNSTTFLYRPKAIINIGNLLEIHPAVDFRYTLNPDLVNEVEIRTWQGIELNWPQVGRILIDHFYRFEQRFHYIENTKEEEIGLRSRYRFRAMVPINKKGITDNTFYSILSAEFFFPHDGEITERHANNIRTGLTFGYNFNSRWRTYITYMLDHAMELNDNNRIVTNRILSINLRSTF